MTQEEKAKCYDEALEIAKKNYVTAQDLCEGSQMGVECFKNTLESIFPELKSEDERIKKEIIEYIKTGTYHKKWIAWLEKQGEKDKLIRELGEYKVKYIQETLGKALTMNNKDDERVRKTTIAFLKDFADKGYENAVECIDWLEKQGEQFDDNIITSSDERIRKAILEGLIDCRDAPDLGWSNFGGIEIDDCIDWLEKQSKEEYSLKSFKDEDVCKFMQYIEKQAKAYEFNLPNRSYDIYAFAKDILIWLENQGEKPQGKSALEAIREEKVDNANKIEPKDYNSIDPYFGKPIDNVEPKFKVGDWITNGDYTWKVISVDKFDYTLQNQWGEYIEDTINYVNKAFHLWTIQDAKEGDVIVDAYGNICVYKKCNAFDWTSYFSLGCNGGFRGFTTIHENKKVCPATKELRELLSQKMKEAGYKWDAEKKELIKEKVR